MKCDGGGLSIPGLKPSFGNRLGWSGNENGVKNLINYIIHLI
jgi:hypothetical protein